MENKAQTLFKKLKNSQNSLYMARVPEKTRIAFMKLAQDEFCGDYGLLLKFLMDDLINQDIKLIIEKLEEVDQRLNILENPVETSEPEKTGRKMLDGTITRRLKNE